MKLPRADRQVSPRPKMTSPKQSPQICEFLQQNLGAYPLQPLHNDAHIYLKTMRHQNVNVVAGPDSLACIRLFHKVPEMGTLQDDFSEIRGFRDFGKYFRIIREIRLE